MTGLSGERLSAVAELWRRGARTITASFDGRSMLPSIQPGQPLTIDCAPFTPAPGEVIAFLHDGQVVVHRVIASRGWVLTRGDANRLVDLPIRDVSRVIGRVVEPVTVGRGRFADRVFVALLRFSYPLGVGALRLLIWLRRRVWGPIHVKKQQRKRGEPDS